MPTITMSPPSLAQRYFTAWNDRDGDAIAACFARDGEYSDPLAGDHLTGDAIAAYARSIWEAFPDLQIQVIHSSNCGRGSIVAQWIIRGTHAGVFRGHAPTGRALSLAGASFIRQGDGGVTSAQSYFDTGAIRRQLELGVGTSVAIGPFSFGSATRVRSGRKSEPRALTVTRLGDRRNCSPAQLREAGFELAQDLLGRPGFIGMVSASMGDELVTVAAWDGLEAAEQQRDRRHSEVMAQWLPPDSATQGVTSIWVPAERHEAWVRCASCGDMSSPQGALDSCHCGARLPEPPATW